MKVKRFLTKAIAVMLAMILSAFSLSAYAEEASGVPDVVFFEGITTTESGYWRFNYKDELVEGSERNYNIAYDAETNTLTLKDASLTSSDFIGYNEYKFEDNCAIASTNDLKINLIGENKISVYESRYSHYGSFGIGNYFGDTYISGDGTLEINMKAGVTAIFSARLMKLVSIKNTSVTVNSDGNGSSHFIAVNTDRVEIEGSTLNINSKGKDYSNGIYSYNNAGSVKVRNSDINMKFENCKSAYGFNIQQVDIEDSTVDVDITCSENGAYGIFTYTFLCNNSYVNCNLEECNGNQNVSAIAYNNASINNDSMQQISTGSIKAQITPRDTYYSSVYINFGNSVFNPFENEYGGYFKAENGSLSRSNEDDWNVFYSQSLNRLYMSNAVLNQPMRAIGSADIVLSGDNVINCSATFAHFYDLNQKFYGDGTLTLISEPACAIMCAEGVEFDDSVTVTASTSIDGSNPVEFRSEDAGYYKWIKIQPSEMPPEPEATEKPEFPEESEKLTLWQRIVRFFENVWDSIDGFFEKIYQSIKQ